MGTIRERIEALGEWFHNLDLGGVQTAPSHPLGDYPRVKWRRFAAAIPADLRGRLLDLSPLIGAVRVAPDVDRGGVRRGALRVEAA